MYPVYNGLLIPGSTNGGPPSIPDTSNTPGVIPVPSNQGIVSIDLYNMSPFTLVISISGGTPDLFMGPNSSKEHVYIGRQRRNDLACLSYWTSNIQRYVCGDGFP